ncbi:lysylphosphatidylglycerol synthase transmembrane domain-containing protein [Actinoallomurus sp. CA-142502]|uniref:lysylphosphatidylglycerol synthase transmembrane domain-containing protein n=1 Tax=Actinoallomurus sp. CA-142502 TaxID=3239885 RepID=UPI003D911C3D
MSETTEPTGPPSSAGASAGTAAALADEDSAPSAPATALDVLTPGRVPPPVDARRRRLMWAGRVVMAGTVVVCLVVFHDDLPDPEAMWRSTLHAGPGWLACAVLAQAASMAMFARVQRRLLRAGGVRMSLPRALRMTYAGNALSTTLPAGPAISVAFNFRQYRRAGAPPRLATAVVMLGGVIMTGSYAVVGLAALVAAPGSRALAVSGLAVLAVGAGVCAVVAWRHGASLARLTRRLARPFLRHRLAAPYAARLREGRAGLRLRPSDWAMLSFASLFNWVFDILSLAAAGRAVGVHTALYSITLAYFAAQAAGTLVPLLPGGLGAMEGSLAASLVAFGALSAPAGAAVALYRLVSFWGVVGVGWLAWLAVKAGEKDGALPALDGGWGLSRSPRP